MPSKFVEIVLHPAAMGAEAAVEPGHVPEVEPDPPKPCEPPALRVGVCVREHGFLGVIIRRPEKRFNLRMVEGLPMGDSLP